MKLFKFYAEWCNPCKQQTKILENCPIKVESINVDESYYEETIEKFQIRSLPTLIFTDDEGKEIHRFTGLTQLKDIEEFITNYKEGKQ